MAYEYEAMISNSISKNKDYFFTTTAKDMKDELQEVYRKARAWDNYLLSVEKDAKNEFGDNQALIKHAVELNKKIFMEDE